MSELPLGWEWVKVSTIADVGTGSTPLRSTPNFYANSGLPWVTSAATSQVFISSANEYVTEAAITAHRLKTYPPGTLLIAMYGEGKTRGQVSELQISAAINQACAAIVVDEAKALRRYVRLALQANYMVMRALAEGGNQPNLNLSKIKEFEIPLPPLAEQTRIANQLDTLLTRVQACNDRFDAIPALLKRFRQTVLTAASTGDLTRDWRESKPPTAGAAAKEVKHRLAARRDKHAAKSKSKFKEPVQPDLAHWRLDVPESWSVESVSAFSECLDHVRVPVTKDKRATAERLYPYFGANGQVDMVDDFLFDDELVMVTEDETFYGRVKPIAYRFSGRCWVNNHAHVLLAADHVRADYLCFSLMHYDVQPWLTGTTGRAKLTQGALNALPLAVPPQAEMVEIVRRVNSMFALADRIEARCNAARTQAQRLSPLLLAKAFRGELVPQDPYDEPASALLERIASTNTAVAGKNMRKVPVALKKRA